MANFYHDFASDTLGGAPASVTQVTDGSATEYTETVEARAGAPGDRALRFYKTAGNLASGVFERFYLDAAGSAITDGEVLTEVEVNDATNPTCGTFLRGNATGDGYGVTLAGSGGITLLRMTSSGAGAGAITTVTGVDANGWPTDSPILVRARVDGTRIRARAWRASLAEPTTWPVDYDTAPDATKYASGSSGAMFRGANVAAGHTMWTRRFAVATGADTATFVVNNPPTISIDQGEGATLIYGATLQLTATVTDS